MDEKIRTFVGFQLNAVVSQTIAVFVDEMKAASPSQARSRRIPARADLNTAKWFRGTSARPTCGTRLYSSHTRQSNDLCRPDIRNLRCSQTPKRARIAPGRLIADARTRSRKRLNSSPVLAGHSAQHRGHPRGCRFGQAESGHAMLPDIQRKARTTSACEQRFAVASLKHLVQQEYR